MTDNPFQDKSDKRNGADFNYKRCPAGPLKGVHYIDYSDGADHFVCTLIHTLRTEYSSAHPLIFHPFSSFIPHRSLVGGGLMQWKNPNFL